MSADFLLQIGSVWPYLLLIVLLLIVLTAVLLSGLVRRSGSAPSIAPGPNAPDKQEPAAREPGRKPVGRILRGTSLSASFSRATSFLKANVAGRDHRYQIPWFLMMGEPASGKSTILANTGVPLSFEAPGAQDPLEWRFFDRGILLGTPGEFIDEESGTGDLRDWRRVLRLLQKYRSRRPLDGVVLVVPATDLVGPGAMDEPAVGRAATRIADRLSQAQRVLGMTFPVYVLVSKCDELAGFGEFARELPASLRDCMFGWSSPYHLDASFSPDWVDEAMDRTLDDLDTLQSEIFVERNGYGHPEEVFIFPEEFAALREPLRRYLGRLFRETAYREGFHFRGLYFTGDITERAPAELESPLALSLSPLELAIREAQPLSAAIVDGKPARPRLPAFLKDLFEKKIFAEHGIARPLAGVYISRNRTVLSIQAAAAVLTLILLIGSILGFRRVKSDAARVEPMLVQLVNMRRTPERDRHNLLVGEGHNLLLSMAAAGDVRLKSPFLLTSYFSSADDDISRVMTYACNQWVMADLRAGLERRARELLDRRPVDEKKEAEGDEIVLYADVESTQEYQKLEKFAKDLQVLRENADTYEGLRTPGRVEDVERIGKLTQYLYHQNIGQVQPNGHFARALDLAEGPPFIISSNDRESASEIMRELSAELFDKWFGNSLLLNNVMELKDKVAVLEQGKNVGYQELRTALDGLKEVDDDLSSPRFRWISSTRLDLNGSFRRVLRDPIEVQRNPYLNKDVLEYVTRIGEDHLNRLRAELTAQRTGMTGPLVDIRDMGQLSSSGRDVQLSAGARALQLALENALNLRFMSQVPTRQIRVSLDPNTRLIWRIEPLQEAVRLYETYTRFVDEGLRDSPDRLRSQLGRVALDRMKLNAEDAIAQAQEFLPRPLTRDRTTGEEDTLAEVTAFKTGVEPLVQLATKFKQNGAMDIHNRIMRIMTLQSLNMLQVLDARLNEQDPYVSKGRNFGWWNGQGSLSLAAYEVRSAADLSDYLNTQRERIKFLQQEAEPFVRFLETWFPTRGEGQGRLLAKWQRIIADFQQYDGKRPGASVTALEEFITTEMDKITPENSCKTAASTRDSRESDYFLVIRNNLRQAVAERCEALSAATVYDAYNDIANQFNNTLAGRFPFASPGPNEAISNEASPEAIAAFFQLLDKSGKAARGTLKENTRFGNSAAVALQFLDQMEQLRPFIAATAPDAEKEPPLTFDFIPHFRVNTQQEIAGNQIIEWTLQVGGQIWHQGEPDHPGRWRVGNPIRLSLRFAKDSLDYPVRDAAQPNMRIRGERNAFFEFTNRWALLAFLRRQEAPHSELIRSADLKPYTLKLRMKTARDVRWQAEQNPAGQAVVYLSMRLFTPGAKVPLQQQIPAFPVKAPKLERPANQ